MISQQHSMLLRRSPAATQPIATRLKCDRLRMSVLTRGLKENVAALPPIDNVDAVEVVASGGSGSSWLIRNAPGTAASAKIFAHLAAANSGEIGAAAALEGLRLYGEYVDEARAVPGSHPNIDILLNIAEAGAPPVRVTLKKK